MRIVYNGCVFSVKEFSWSTCRGPFEVLRKDNSLIVDAEINDSDMYAVSTLPGRILSRSEIVPTVRLYLSSHKIRKTLASAETMVIRSL